MALAALNHWRLTPRLEAGNGSALRPLRISIVCETAVAGLVLAVTAAMTTLTGFPAAP